MTHPFFAQYLNKKKKAKSQPAVTLSDEEFHGTTALVGSLNFFHFGTEQLGSVLWELRNNFV